MKYRLESSLNEINKWVLRDQDGKFITKYDSRDQAISMFNTMASICGLKQRANGFYGHSTNAMNLIPITMEDIE